MKRLLWLDEKKDEIIELYKNNKRQIEIADYFGVSQTAISIRLRDWGISNPDGNRFKRLDLNKETIRRLYWDEELHPSQIAKKYGCTKQVITNRMLEWGISFRTKSEARVGKLNPLYDVGHTMEARQKMSKAFSNGRKMGFSGEWGSPILYETPHQGVVKMRSGWEVKTAEYLTGKNIDWYYEYRWINLGYARYLPDFYLPLFDLYVEVKGRKKDIDIEKVKVARRLGFKILLWDGEELLKRRIIDNSGSTEINRKYR